MSDKDSKDHKAKEARSRPQESRREIPRREAYHETLEIMDEMATLLVPSPDS